MRTALKECRHGHLFDVGNTIIRNDGSRNCRKCRQAYRRKYRRSEQGRPKWWKYYLAWSRRTWNERKYGLTPDAMKALGEKQLDLCAICLCGLNVAKQIHVDHDHRTGRVRGLLCGDCNRGLGAFRDNPDALNRAIEYIALNK